ncbi:hypothetical protein CXB51_033910 [Gossypium anomalum]|uniref:Integrase catalytic domain-containing protein n=1 Tax=Gossypium anomalum TaxID=47600 RepID=A0A8J6CGA2_9ROSI|nr:hypothetical protein CXB51_033910 [Gossypium anomalum]
MAQAVCQTVCVFEVGSHGRVVGHVPDCVTKCFRTHDRVTACVQHINPTPIGDTENSSKTLHKLRLTKTQLEALHKLLGTPTASGSLAIQGTALTTTHKPITTSWILDSGASDHMTGNLSLFHTYLPCNDHSRIRIADESYSPVAGMGTVRLTENFSLDKVLHVPNLSYNLLSISKLTKDEKVLVEFSALGCVVQEQESGKMIGTTKVDDGLYVWNKNSSQERMALSTSKEDSIMLWHRRLGHPNFMYLKKLFPLLFLNKKISSLNCEVCQLSKHTRLPYPLKPYVQSQPFSLIHSDLWGASQVKNITKARWFITFIDDHTRVCWIYLLKEKSEVSRVLQNFHSMVRTQFNSNIHTLRTDNGREYFNSILSPYLSEQGIIHQSSCPDTPQQNGVSERKNRHLVAVARALMFTMGVPKYLWGEAVLTACYLINRLPSKVLNFQTPLHLYIEETLKSTKWRQAVLEEIKALEDNGTWKISKLPTGKKTVGCKWIFTTKFKPYGSIDRYKARLVARGFTQTYGLDYEEAFAPVAKLNTIRVLLSIAVNLEWPLIQLDVKNAFLNRELNEEVYMDFSPGFEGSKGQVCKLKKSLYGLKQSPRAWFNRFAKAMTSRHYTQGQADHTLFYKHSDNGKCCILIVYVDDIILTGGDSIEIERLKEFLSLEFQLKDLGNLRYFLGMEVARSKAGISISQRKYVLDLLSKVGLLGCKPAETPMEPNLKLGTNKDGEKGETFGSCLQDIEILKRDSWRSTSGYCNYVWGNLVTWRSKKQSVVARSSAESEYRALSHGICEGMWLQRLMGELKLSYTKPITLYCDNQAAISIAHNPIHHDRTKHVEIDRHFITEKINKGEICVSYLPTRQQVADVLTKSLSRKMFEEIMGKLGLINIYTPA